MLSFVFIDDGAKYKQYDAAGQAYRHLCGYVEEEYADIVGNLQLAIGERHT